MGLSYLLFRRGLNGTDVVPYRAERHALSFVEVSFEPWNSARLRLNDTTFRQELFHVGFAVPPVAGPWFAPWLALKLLNDGVMTSTDATSESDKKAGWIRTKYLIAVPSGVTLKPRKAAALKEFSEAAAVYIAADAKTLLPAQMVVYDHPNSDPASAVEWTTSYEDYRQEAGFMLPHHVTRYVQHSLQADVVISQIALN